MTKTKKKKYEKPQVRRVALDVRTSILGFCKTTGGRGPRTLNCKVVNDCSQIGS